MSPELILFICLALLIAAAYRPASKAILGGLDARAEGIRKELDEAQRLREEAQTLLAKYQRDLHEGEAQAASILKHAEEEAVRQEEAMRKHMEEAIERRTKQVTDRIASAENRALQEVRGRAAALSIDTTRELIVSKAGEQSGAMIDQALVEVRGQL